MKKIWKRGLSFVLALVMVAGLLPVTAFAAVDSTGKPTDLNNTLVLSIYTPEGSFPGEPAMHGSEDYISFNSQFAKTSASGKFKDSAASELKEDILADIVQGTSSGNNTVWGVFSADGLKGKYFKSDASIIQRENEITMIKAVFKELKKTNLNAEDYEIVWYVIKLQHSPGNWWWSSGTTEWHIDGIIREKKEERITINYYGNGNTEGSAPDGVTNHVSGADYTVLAGENMKKKINGVYVDFLGWSAKADGTGAEAGFYKPGDVIKPTENISLYAMWDTTTQYTATVNTYLDNVLADEADIHDGPRDLYLGTEGHYYQLTRNAEGVYSVKITGNGKFHLFNKDGTNYTQIGTRQLTIYNQNGSMDVHHYSVTYDANGGEFAADPGKPIFYYGDAVTAIEDIPTKDGYRFLGWKDDSGNLIQPGEEVTASITAPVKLTAQWEKTVNVTINVTINHKGGGGYDQMDSMNEVSMALVSRENDSSPYLEVEGKTLNLSDSAHEGFTFKQEENETSYTGYTYTDMPGGDVDYTVVTSKSGYDTTITPKQDAEGNWVIDVVMTYNPSNFDVEFTVVVADSVPAHYIPDAAIVKVTFWATDRNRWEIITQQEGGAPGVRVAIDPATRTGSGTYPVWKYESNGTTPYGYRIQVTSFVYPDGTIVPASDVVTQDVAWTDNVYTATMSDVTGGKKFGTLDGAYIGDTDQEGTLNAVITMDLHNVTFDAQGGKVNGLDEQTVAEQYKIPAFKDYIPTRDGGYIFDGWYEDDAYTTRATEGKDLIKDVTLYAKWIEPLTISGTVTIAGTYDQNGKPVSVHDIDRATEAVVVLQELRNGTPVEVDSQVVSFGDYKDSGSADYSFAGIPNDGKQYQIHVLELNYNTGYDNESDNDNAFTPKEYAAVFGGDNVADVDAHLDFAPPSYEQKLKVDATAIGNGFRPSRVLSEVLYRDTGDNHPYKRISQHDVDPYGVVISLNNDGIGTGSQSIWNWHTDGTLYDYQMNVTKVNGKDYDTDSAPYYITYSAANNATTPEVSLVATLIPKQYLVTYDLNAGTDTVTGVDKLTYKDENNNEVTTDIYGVIHTWSYDTAISAVPQREGYTFLGWQADVEGAYTDSKIPAAIHQNVTLTAQWEQITYQVTTVADPAEGGTVTGAGTYAHGTNVTVTAAPAEGYSFLGWYENGEQVSDELAYSFEILANHDFTAQFSLNKYLVKTSAVPADGGTTTGGGTYDYGTEITLTATANPGYTFVAWQKDTAVAEKEEVSREASFTVTVTENATYEAVFELNRHTVTTVAVPAEGGTTTGDGTFNYGTNVTVKAEAKTGYTFAGWYEGENLACKTAEYTFTVTADRLLEARFEKITYDVIAKAEHGGTAEGTATYSHGDSATVKATVNETYTFAGWYEGETLVSKNLEYTFTVTSDRELTAKFTKNGYRVTAIPNQAEFGTTTGTGDYDEGSTATVTATANEGYKFVGWFEGAEEVSKEATFSFTVTANRKLVAKFAKVYTITTVASPEGAGTLTGGGAYERSTKIDIKAVASGSYYFVGWYDEQDKLITAEKDFSWEVTEDRTFTAKFEKKVSYRCDYVYLFGYNDSVIGAEGPLLRGELAQMIYRLVKQNTGAGHGNRTFDDTQGQWYRTGISYMATVGAIDGAKANAYPEVSVTRGETYKMICLGLGFTTDSSLSFSEYATILRNSGFISGDGRVTEKIQRWEFCALFNAILGRTGFELKDASGNVITHETYNYTDLDPSQHYYETMLIATSTFTNGKVDLAKRAQRNPLDEYGG